MINKYKKGSTEFKEQKKIDTALTAIGKTQEKDSSSLVQESFSQNLFVCHFGKGERKDYEFIETYLQSIQVQDYLLHILPGICFAFLRLNTINNNIKTQKLIHVNDQKSLVFFYSTQDFAQIQGYKIPVSTVDFNIKGLFVIPDFVSNQESIDLMNFIENQPFEKIKQRQVQHYGYKFIYGKNNVDPDNPNCIIPDIFAQLIKKIQEYIQQKMNLSISLDQITVNDYPPNGGIPAHTDSHSPFKEIFVSLSLLHGTSMVFEKDFGNAQENIQKEKDQNVYVPKNALMIFSDAARYEYTHAIQSRQADFVNEKYIWRERRVSITIRKININSCRCLYKNNCQT